MTPQEIRTNLAQYIGTEAYHRFSILTKLVLTDGAKGLCEMCGCYWLMDIIASYQGKKLEAKTDGFQVWKLTKIENKWLVTCDDGNDNIAVKQVVKFSDFPLEDGIKVYCTNNVILLPSEY